MTAKQALVRNANQNNNNNSMDQAAVRIIQLLRLVKFLELKGDLLILKALLVMRHRVVDIEMKDGILIPNSGNQLDKGDVFKFYI